MIKRPPPERPRSEIAQALADCRFAVIALGFSSAIVNILYLSGSLYMLEVYDRVLPSRSMPTLIGLSVLVLALFVFQAALDLLRGRILIRVGRSLGQNLSGRVYDIIAELSLQARINDGTQPLRELDQVRNFLSSQGPLAFLDLPWIPFYVGICFIFHSALGVAALVGAIVLVSLTIFTEMLIRAPTRTATAMAGKRNSLAEASRRNAEVIHAMGMGANLRVLWSQANTGFLDAQQHASDVSGGFGSISRVLRMVLQSCMLGIGAYLVVHEQATPGIIIAASIIAGRAIAPVDLAIAHWRSFIATRQSWHRLNSLLILSPPHQRQMPLPPPNATFTVDGVTVVPPRCAGAVVQNVTFRLEKGNGLAIIGPSASGKSCLVRSLVGAWQPTRGTIRIDGSTLNQWTAETLGRHIGYLPQDIELFAGTIAQNIARFEPEHSPKAVVEAAKAAGVHDVILRLPNGYDTEIGEGGAALSAGQRQRIALARALYGEPFLVVLDEPNSNMDAEGEAALTRAIMGIRARGGIAIIVAHRPNAIASVDLVMIMADGKMQMIGPKDEILARLSRHQAPRAPELRAQNESAGIKR